MYIQETLAKKRDKKDQILITKSHYSFSVSNACKNHSQCLELNCLHPVEEINVANRYPDVKSHPEKQDLTKT